MSLMRRAREAIVRDEFPAFVRKFFRDLYGGVDGEKGGCAPVGDDDDGREKYPVWAVNALQSVGIDLTAVDVSGNAK